MNKGMLSIIISENIVMLGVITIYIFCIINRGKILSFLKDIFMIKDIVIYIIGLAIGILLVGYVFNRMIPDFKDISNAINDNYKIEQGIVLEDSSTSTKGKLLVIKFSTENKEIIRITTYGIKLVNKGDYVKVKYLPNSKRGVIIEHRNNQ